MVKRNLILIVPLLIVFTSYSMQPIHNKLFECLQVLEETCEKELTQEERLKELCNLMDELQEIEKELAHKINEHNIDIDEIKKVQDSAQNLFFGLSEYIEQENNDRQALWDFCKERPELFDIVCMTLIRGTLDTLK